jgi:hypothetical protein
MPYSTLRLVKNHRATLTPTIDGSRYAKDLLDRLFTTICPNLAASILLRVQHDRRRVSK